MACIYGVEQPCDECRMCGKGQVMQTVDVGKRCRKLAEKKKSRRVKTIEWREIN